MNRLQTKLEKIGRDVKITAKAVGLKYIADRSKGYFRIKEGDSFAFVMSREIKLKMNCFYNGLRNWLFRRLTKTFGFPSQKIHTCNLRV